MKSENTQIKSNSKYYQKLGVYDPHTRRNEEIQDKKRETEQYLNNCLPQIQAMSKSPELSWTLHNIITCSGT